MPSPPPLPRPLVTAMTVLISVMWAANLVIGWLDPDRSDPAVNAIFAIVAGAAYGLHLRAKKTADPDRAPDDRGDKS